MKLLAKALLIACAAVLGSGLAPPAAAPLTVPAADWPYNGRDLQEQRFSPLNQIDGKTVGKLGLAWRAEFDTDRGQEATPIVTGGVLYTSTAWSTVAAFDAATGRPLWKYDPKVNRETLASACCDAVNRGVAVLGGKVFVGTLDGRLIALDARTGKPTWSVDTLDRRHPKMHYTITGAPRVVKDKIVIGNGGAEFGVRGYVTAYYAATGKLAWRFYTVPNPDGKPDGAASDDVLRAKAAASWSDGEWKTSGGGGTAWDSMTFDPAANLLYIGTGNGGPFDWQRRSGGKGDNLFLSSIVAVDPDTGKYVWHYQTSPSDSWDYTATQHLISARLTIDGRPRDIVMQAPKNGFFYVLDRRSGKLLSAKPFVDVTWATGIDANGRPIEAPNVHYQNGPSVQKPGPFGAHSWQAMSFSPRTGLVYIPVQIMSGDYEAAPNVKLRPIGQNILIQMKSFPQDAATLAAIKAATHGRLLAWDPVAQKPRWSVDHPSFLNGGTLATAGDLVFQGTIEGIFSAYDARTGRKVWSYDAQNGVIAPPISYAIGGRQYIAVMAGFGGAGAIVGKLVPDQPRRMGRLLVFRLGGIARARSYDDTPAAPIDVVGAASKGDPVAGEAEYNQTCSVCHGANASIRYTADLRRSGALRDQAIWKAIVIDGALKDTGMISFAPILTAASAEDIRAYVLNEAVKASSAGGKPSK